MKIRLLAVGKSASSLASAMENDYSQRIQRFYPLDIVEVGEYRRRKRRGEKSVALKQEGERLLKQFRSGALIVALDRQGRSFSSEGFASQMMQWQEQGRMELCFVIGGPDGLSASVLQKSAFKLSFGAMTYPHMLFRVMLLEQIYRAVTLNRGLPYHR
ncbi:23S rRNA (pseudouridine(1915)-N(3))-methyltransferase RlmH [Magnetococcales bacterium HHB-1]